MNGIGLNVLRDKKGERTLIGVVQHSYRLSEVCECRVQQSLNSTEDVSHVENRRGRVEHQPGLNHS